MAKTLDYDVVVIGAGPAGSTVARVTAAYGLSVLMIDKSCFPRNKACGGGLTIKALRRVPPSVTDVVKSRTGVLRIGLGYDYGRKLSAKGPICVFVVRSEFDDRLRRESIRAGADFRVSSFSEISQSDDHAEVILDNGTVISCAFVVGADGANSKVRRVTDQQKFFRHGIAIEGLVDFAEVGDGHEMEFSFGVIDGGYGWVFPKDDHYNVGLYSYKSGTKISKEMLRMYAHRKLGQATVRGIVGGAIAFGGNKYARIDGRIVLVGDAAGMVEPLLGEGLYNALRSADICAKCIIDSLKNCDVGRMTSYSRATWSIRQDIRVSHDLARFVFYPALRAVGYRLLSSWLISRCLMNGYAAGLRLLDIVHLPFIAFFAKPIDRPHLGLGRKKP